MARAGWGILLVLTSLLAAACGSAAKGASTSTTSPGAGSGTTVVIGENGLSGGSSTSSSTSSTSSSSTSSSTTTTTVSGGTTLAACSLGVIEQISGESSTEDQTRTTGWTTLSANNWTVFVPSGSWHLSASDAGADVLSPTGTSDASLGSWPQQTPWSYATLGAKILGAVSQMHVICQSPSEHGAGGYTQATEFTGVFQGNEIHAIAVLSLLTPTEPDLYTGETRSIYTPASDWTTSNEEALWLIVKRAIFVPPT